MLAERSPQMKAPIVKLMELNQDEEARMLYEAREKERQDIRVMERGAERKKALDIAGKLLGMKLPIDDIARATGLSHEEIEGLT